MADDKLVALEKRVSRGFDWLLERELAKQTDSYYEGMFQTWEKLLRDYEAALTALHRGAA